MVITTGATRTRGLLLFLCVKINLVHRILELYCSGISCAADPFITLVHGILLQITLVHKILLHVTSGGPYYPSTCVYVRGLLRILDYLCVKINLVHRITGCN